MSYRQNNLVGLIYDMVAAYIENTAERKGGIREWYADILLANNLRNKEFSDLCGLLEDDFDTIAEETDRAGRMTEEQILKRVIPSLVDGHLAVLAVSDRRVSDQLDDRTYDDMVRVAEQWKDMWLAPPSRSRSRDRGGRVDRDRRSFRDRDDRSSGRSGRGYGRDAEEFREATRSRVTYRNDGDRPRGEGRGGPVRTGLYSGIKMVNENNQLDEAEEIEDVRQPTREDRRTFDKPTSTSGDGYLVEGIDWTKAKPHYEYYQDGERWLFCKHPDAVEIDKGTKYLPTFVDVNERLRFLVQDSDNNIREEFVKVTDDNRYLQHELMMDPTSQNGTVRRTRVSLTKGANTEEESAIAESPVTERTPLAQVLSSSSIARTFSQYDNNELNPSLVVSLKEAVEDVRLKMDGNDAITNTGVYFVRDVVVLMNSGSVEESNPILEQLDNATTLSQFHEILDKYKDVMDNNLWRKINQRMSDQLAMSMRYQWRTPSKSDLDFHRVYPVMIEKLMEVKGAEWIAKFAQRATALIERVMSRLEQNEVGVFLKDTLATNATKAIVFMDFEYIVGINRTADALGIGNQLMDKRTGVAVRELESSRLPATVRSLYTAMPLADAARQMVQPIRLVTSDYQVVTILPYMARHDEFILSQPIDTL